MITKEDLDAEIETRKVFRAVFCGTPDGGSVLTWILNECGYFSADPQIIDPVLIALSNRILNKIGIVHPDNLFTDTKARVEIANDLDLRAQEKKLTEVNGNDNQN